MSEAQKDALSKTPAVTFGFWIVKILATTLGETGGDAVTMSLDLGYAIGTAIFMAIFLVAVYLQIRAKTFSAPLYWLTIIATTTVGTTMADFADRSLGIGYAGGSAILLAGLVGSLAVWRWVEGSVAVATVATPRTEIFYWVTILFSQTLGTALGDWMADTNDLGFSGGALVFGLALAVVAGAYCFTKISHVARFWAAFVLTRPLGATVGDLLDKPHELGGLGLSRYLASLVLLVLIVGLVALLPQLARPHPGQASDDEGPKAAQ